jgi:hypothetical protein
MATDRHERSNPAIDLADWGRWSALVCGLGAVAYGVAGVLVGVLATSAITWESLDQFVSDYRPLPTLLVLFPSFLVALVFPVLVVSVYSTIREERRPLGLAALLFAGVYTAVLGADYWLQLTNVPWNILRDSTEGLAPWVLWNPASLFWSFEAFGYFAMGVSCFFLGLAHDPGVLPRRLRRGLMGMGALGVLFLVNNLKDLVVEAVRADGHRGIEGLATGSALSLVFAWVILFGFVSFSFARWFAHLRSTGSGASPKDVTSASSREGVSWPAT